MVYVLAPSRADVALARGRPLGGLLSPVRFSCWWRSGCTVQGEERRGARGRERAVSRGDVRSSGKQAHPRGSVVLALCVGFVLAPDNLLQRAVASRTRYEG